ncbi:hypothetical protein GGI20_006386, partial [Coemansia sp. BCRC 34301]
ALVYNAFLAAVHETKECLSSSPRDDPAASTTALHAEFAAIGETMPPAERAKLAERLIHMLHDKSSSSNSETTTDPPAAAVPIVAMPHFESAFASTHASLAAADRERFAKIYSAFVNDKKAPSIDRPKHTPIEQRATLA